MSRLIIHTDGGARGNPGPAAIGAVIKSEELKILTSIARTIGQSTNNVAEYTAVIAALEWVKKNVSMIRHHKVTKIDFYLDSTLVVNQLNGLFKIKDHNLKVLRLNAQILEQTIGLPITYSYIPREKNQTADFLVNQALDRKT